MSEDKSIKLFKAAKELNIGTGTIVDFLASKGYKIEKQPNAKIEGEMYDALLKEFQADKITKEEAKQISIGKIRREETGVPEHVPHTTRPKDFEQEEILVKNLHTFSPPAHPVEKPKPLAPVVTEHEESSLPGVKVVGKIDLDNLNKPKQEVKVETPEPVKPEPVAAAPVAAPVEKIPEAPKPEPIPQPVAKVEEKAPVVEEIEEVAGEEDDVIRAKAERLTGPNVIGKITLPVNTPKRNQPIASSNSAAEQRRKRKRKENAPGQRPQTNAPGQQNPQGQQPGQQPGGAPRPEFKKGQSTISRPDFRNKGQQPTSAGGQKEEPSEKEIQDQIKATLARLSGAGKSGKFAQRAKFRRQKRDDVAAMSEQDALEQELQSKVLKVTEFVTANELASMMDVSVTQIISTCMSLGMFVSINQRLDAETLSIVAEEFGFEVEFVKPQDEEANLNEPDDPADLIPRAPIVTIMGHVDHGKTSLLDFIRKTNVIGGEAGGITQHIGAYEVTLPENKGKITFLDTPGHEAFTAMRARGAQVTDIVIIVIAADDSVMPQTREAINHAQAAGAPIIFAFNKIDKPGANADKVREQLSAMNILVEEWGGKYQSQEISAKTGLNVDLLLEKVLLEAELLELKANPNKRAVGTVIEAALDKGRGIVTTVLVQAGTLRVGDPILAGCYSGRVKALTNERGQRVESAGPSTPVQVLGMQGAPTAGDKFNALESEPEAREIANKRLQLQREQGLRTQKHITLDEIGRRLAIGNFKELNIIVKGDVDGSIEALSDSLLKLSTDQIQVNIISKAVGQISESDVLLASASDAIIIGFQVRPSGSARKLAEQEQIDIRLYSIIYDAINEIKAAMEGMLAPTFEEKIVANVEIRETFKISKVGTIAGCMVLDGKINRNSKIRIIREGVVIYTGELASLKRFKDDVKEVATGYECGLNIHNFNNIEVGDIVEAYENVEVKRKL
ncbi:translation initiation factor IF-2 [uncultured Mucilaginibacter sp.]|uniref:translation initiation factor IF-2 n=1 Tax=uncultured Mucilaginibacter sp. TaxID=797541 RepID=UPI0025D520BE|nr:translation initiation factor IF-2 [uncultured Mucilaginibacter sp.]